MERKCLPNSRTTHPTASLNIDIHNMNYYYATNLPKRIHYKVWEMQRFQISLKRVKVLLQNFPV
jgi:hypothetical protein